VILSHPVAASTSPREGWLSLPPLSGPGPCGVAAVGERSTTRLLSVSRKRLRQHRIVSTMTPATASLAVNGASHTAPVTRLSGVDVPGRGRSVLGARCLRSRRQSADRRSFYENPSAFVPDTEHESEYRSFIGTTVSMRNTSIWSHQARSKAESTPRRERSALANKQPSSEKQTKRPGNPPRIDHHLSLCLTVKHRLGI
jgi:hypothetical protein